MLDNPMVFDEDMLKDQSIKTLIQAMVGFAVVGGGMYYMYRSKVDEMKNNPDVETVEVFVDEHNNIVSRDDIESGVYQIDFDKEPLVSIVDDGEVHSIDPDTYNDRPSNRRPIDRARSAARAYSIR